MLTPLWETCRNCGRFIEITFGPNCVGNGNAPFTEPPVVCGVNAFAADPLQNYRPDQYTGKKVYAVVADSCQDNNYWCAQCPHLPHLVLRCHACRERSLVVDASALLIMEV